MNKKFAAVGLTAILAIGLTNCTGDKAAAAQLNIEQSSVLKSDVTFRSILTPSIKRYHLDLNTQKMTNVINKLTDRVNKTWYVFGGSTPRGWDCSGLVLWTYKHFGINLYHSAFAQKYSAKPHTYSDSKAKVGDIIAFPGHVGIYVGNGYMIHAPHPGVRTQKIKVWKWAKENGTRYVTYTRLIKTN